MVRRIQGAMDREWRTLALAALAHGALAVAVVFLPARSAPPSDIAPAEIDVLVDEPVAPPEPIAPEPTDPAPAAAKTEARAAARAAARDLSAAVAVGRAHDETPAPVPAPSSEAPPAPSERWSPSWTIPGTVDIGLDGGIAWAPPPVSARDRGTPTDNVPRYTDPGGLRRGLDEHDRDLGLGSGGTVVSAVHAAATAVATARDGAATIEVVTDAAGHVTAVRVLDCTSDAQAWQEAARAIAAVLQGKTLPVPRGARGVAVTVRAEVAMRLPSGATHGITPNGAGIGFDISDIGAHAVPVVHARVVGEQAL